jgi:hypothetical protein
MGFILWAILGFSVISMGVAYSRLDGREHTDDQPFQGGAVALAALIAVAGLTGLGLVFNWESQNTDRFGLVYLVLTLFLSVRWAWALVSIPDRVGKIPFKGATTKQLSRIVIMETADVAAVVALLTHLYLTK